MNILASVRGGVWVGLLACSVQMARAQAPELGGVVPSGGPRGQTTQVRIDGKNLTGAKVYLGGTGVAVKSLTVSPAGDAVTADLAVESGAKPGPREIRLANSKGVSAGTRFWVDILPNRVMAQPMTEAMPPVELDGNTHTVVNGRILNKAGRDRFLLNAAAGDTWSFECYADRIRSRFDPVLDIRDEAGVSQRLVQSTWESDPHFVHRFAKAGKYLLTVRDSEYNGGPNYTYRLLAGRLPFVAGFLPRGGQPGQTLTLNLDGVGLTSKQVPVTIPTDATSGTCWAEVPGIPTLLPLLIGSEPVLNVGDTATGATLSSFPQAVDGVFGRSPRATFAFHGKAGARYLFDLLGRRIGSRIDGMIRILDSKGKELASNDDAPGLGKEARLEFGVPSNSEGDYSVEVSNVEEVTGPDCYYRLRATPVVPDFQVSIETDRLTVPRGNTLEIPVKLERIGGYAGPVNIRLEGLPAGMTGQGGLIAPGRNDLNVTLTAAPDAAFNANGIRIIGEALLNGKSVSHQAPGWERYEHRSIDLVLSVEYGYTRPHHLWDLLLAEVTDRNVPITVTSGMSDVALMPGKSVEVPVHVAREANAKNAITLEVRNLPNKVTAALVQIPANQTDGKLTLTAAADATPDATNLLLQAKHDNATALAPAIHVSVLKP